MSDLNSDLDHDGTHDGSGEESGEGTGQGSEDDFDQAKLTEKDVKQVLNDKVIFLFLYLFLLNFLCLVHYYSYPRMFPISSTTITILNMSEQDLGTLQVPEFRDLPHQNLRDFLIATTKRMKMVMKRMRTRMMKRTSLYDCLRRKMPLPARRNVMMH